MCDSNEPVVFLLALILGAFIGGALIGVVMHEPNPEREKCIDEYGKDNYLYNGTDCVSKGLMKERIYDFLEIQGGEWKGGYKEISIYIGYEPYQEWDDYRDLEELMLEMQDNERIICGENWGSADCKIINQSIKKQISVENAKTDAKGEQK